MPDTVSRTASLLLANHAAFAGFIRRHVGDSELAEDILQDCLLSALGSDNMPEDEEKAVSWFYRIIRNAITDAYRRGDARTRGLLKYALEQPDSESPPEDPASLCGCFRGVLPTMKPEYAELIESMDLNGEPAQQITERLGITRNNLKVRHHRAREQLRHRLEETCRTCADDGCLDCSCVRA